MTSFLLADSLIFLAIPLLKSLAIFLSILSALLCALILIVQNN